MINNDYCPKLRPIDIIPVKESGQTGFILRDSSGLSDKIAFVTKEVAFLVSLFDGKNNILDLKTSYMRQFGRMLFQEDIESIIKTMDEYLFLDSDNFRRHLEKVKTEYEEKSTRSPFLAGKSYPASPDELSDYLEAIIERSSSKPISSSKKVAGIIAPHIDLERGGRVYGEIYNSIREQRFDLFVILGISHVGMKYHFALTYKDFETPFGILHTEQDIVDTIAKKLPFDPFYDEFNHRSEHSIEFQTLFISHLWNDNPPYILPILCGSFHEFILAGKTPEEDEHYMAFKENLIEAINSYSGNVCILAAVDLSHVGRQFGDPYLLDPFKVEEISKKDMEMLERVAICDSKGFIEYIIREQDIRKVCGIPAIYLLTSILDKTRGNIISYDKWVDETGMGMVSFVGMVFTKD